MLSTGPRVAQEYARDLTPQSNLKRQPKINRHPAHPKRKNKDSKIQKQEPLNKPLQVIRSVSKQKERMKIQQRAANSNRSNE